MDNSEVGFTESGFPGSIEIEGTTKTGARRPPTFRPRLVSPSFAAFPKTSSSAPNRFLSQWRPSIGAPVQRDSGTSPLLSNRQPMPSDSPTTIAVDGQRIDLRNRHLAAFLAWLVPGLGHMYQGRYTKGSLFFVCILSAWILGFALGGSTVVYASWQPGDKRWHFLLQAGAGAVAMPAIVQGNEMRKFTDNRGRTKPGYEPWWNGFMAPPDRPVVEGEPDLVAAWYATRGAGYEMGTWYTVIAGLLNILVIYDAYGGPLAVPISGRKKEKGAENKTDDSESNINEGKDEVPSSDRQTSATG